MIDLLASERHYLDHLAPVWFALPPEQRGTAWVTGPLAQHPDDAVALGVVPHRVGIPPAAHVALVASYRDCRAHKGPAVYLEHGAGQRYDLGGGARDPSFAGSAEHDNVVLFLCPREEVAGWWRDVYPRVPAVAVGCPKLDHVSRARDTYRGRTVAVSFHADARLLPETTSAWRAYDPHLPGFVAAMRAERVEVLGHGHPRLWDRLEPRWKELGVEPVRSFHEVLARARVYACDNSSTLPEAAAAGLSLVWVDSPHWRRDVEHGGRFWTWPQGQVECRHPSELAGAVLTALRDDPAAQAARQRMVEAIYGPQDGRASQRAAAAIVDICG